MEEKKRNIQRGERRRRKKQKGIPHREQWEEVRLKYLNSNTIAWEREDGEARAARRRGGEGAEVAFHVLARCDTKVLREGERGTPKPESLVRVETETFNTKVNSSRL